MKEIYFFEYFFSKNKIIKEWGIRKTNYIENLEKNVKDIFQKQYEKEWELFLEKKKNEFTILHPYEDNDFKNNYEDDYYYKIDKQNELQENYEKNNIQKYGIIFKNPYNHIFFAFQNDSDFVNYYHNLKIIYQYEKKYNTKDEKKCVKKKGDLYYPTLEFKRINDYNIKIYKESLISKEKSKMENENKNNSIPLIDDEYIMIGKNNLSLIIPDENKLENKDKLNLDEIKEENIIVNTYTNLSLVSDVNYSPSLHNLTTHSSKAPCFVVVPIPELDTHSDSKIVSRPEIVSTPELDTSSDMNIEKEITLIDDILNLDYNKIKKNIYGYLFIMNNKITFKHKFLFLLFASVSIHYFVYRIYGIKKS